MYYYFTNGRVDRSGAQIHDMMFAYAYCFHRNIPYIGSKLNNHIKDVLPLIKFLNFLDVNIKYKRSNLRLLYPKIYRNIDSKIFTNNFIKNICSKFKYEEKNKDIFKIAIHIRRGDVTPKKFWKEYCRYLPNKYYLQFYFRTYK